MRLKLLFTAIALFVVCGTYGQLLQWNTYGNLGTETSKPSVTNDANITSSNLTLGAGVTATANGNRIGGSGWFNAGNTVAGNTLTEAVTGNDYIQFVVTPNSGYSFTPTSFVFTWDRSGTGPSSVTLRSSVDSFVSDVGSVTAMVSGGAATITSRTITISGLTNITTATTFRIYGYGATGTGGTGGFDIDSDVENVQLNGTTASTGPTSTKSGDWNDSTVWSISSVPASTDNVTIASGHIVYTSTALTRTGATIVNGSFQLNAGGWASGTNFIYGSNGTLIFNATYGAYNGNYWPATNGPVNVTVNTGCDLTLGFSRTVAGTFQTAAGVNFDSTTLTLNGNAKINAGGFFNQSPIFGNASTLIYNTGVTVYGRGYEWNALGVGTIGATQGYPNNIQLTGNTTLNYNNGTPLAKAINGNLIIDSGSSFYMDYGGSASGGVITVAGNVTNNGSFTLGNASGDDLKLGGNFINTGTFNGNNRAIFFTKNGIQTVSSVAGLTIPYVVFSGGTTVQLATGTNMLISAPNEGNAISFTNSSDVFDINIGNTLTIGTTGVANSITGAGTFKGSISSNLTLLGLGSIGTLSFKPNFQELGTFIMNRQAATVGCAMGSNVTINSALKLTSGLISLGNFDISLKLTAINTGSANSFVVSDPDAGTGKLTKRVDSLGPYTLHIGENNAPNGAQYAPATINFSSGTFSAQAYYGVQVKDAIHPNIDSPIDYLTKYWIITSSGTFDTPVYSFTGTYTFGNADINGTESNCISAKWDGSKWTNGSTIEGGTLTINGLTKMATSSTNEISAGNRNREINIKGLSGAGNNIVSGGVTANGLNNTLFAETNIGSSAIKDYEIQNLGIAALNLTGTPIVSVGGANPSDFKVTTVPSTTIVGGSSTTFVITFSPTYGGIRAAVVSIANNDSDENPYTFLIQGTGNCSISAINTIMPTSGPVGTEVTITATANNLTEATVSFNGVVATAINYLSSTQIKVIVPSGAISGNIVVTNASGCSTTNTFTVVNNLVTSCQAGSSSSDLFISEVTDATTGGLTYIEIYNGTGSTINLSNYALQTFSNGSSTTSSIVNLNNVHLTSGSIYVVALGISASPDALDTCILITGGNGEFANQVSTNAGINFDNNGNDYIALYNTSTNNKVDSFGTYENNTWASSLGIGDRGVVFRRKITATLPSVTYSHSDWDITNWTGSGSGSCSTNDYSNIGTYTFTVSTPPTITTHPSYTPTCKAATLTVSGTEGFAEENPLTYQWLVSAPNATGWTELTDNTNYSGSSSPTLSIANISTAINYQYYCQIRENTNTCYTASNAVKIIDGTITWDGTNWRDVNNAMTVPTIDKLAIINANYNTSTVGLDSFSACSVVVNSPYTLTITANKYVNIQNDLTNNGVVTIKNNGSLVQVNDDAVNTGNIRYERTTPPIFRTDYTYWSSPVAGYTLGGVSQNLTLWDKYYSYDSSAEAWKQESSGTSMVAGTGYIIRGNESDPFQNPFYAFFIGKPNNGEYSIPTVVVDKPYLLGNPYPSALDADTFLAVNSGVLDGTLYFWTHKTPLSLATSIPNPGPGWAYTYSLDDYAAYNPVGGVGIDDFPFTAGGSPAPNGSAKPTGKIASGQGFFASSKTSLFGSSIIYNNSMRAGVGGITGDNSQFFKTKNTKEKTIKTIEKHRIWLNLKNTQGAFKQTLIGYITDATNEYDSRFDGKSYDAYEFVDFYSINQDKNLVIQGRALPFDENDEVPLGFRTTIEGAFTINIDQVDGDLTNQSVFIEDKLTDTVFDLKTGNYTFNTVAGTFNDRFILRYTSKTLGTADLETLENQVLVSNKNKQIKVNSAVATIDKVLVYDLLGRLLFKKDKVNSNELSILNLISSQQTVLVKVSLQNGQTITKKIIY